MVVSALYVSAGDDTKALTFTHPAFLERQAGHSMERIGFYVYVDKEEQHDAPLAFDDGRTRITTVEQRPHPVHDFEASLLRVSYESADLPSRELAVLRVLADNESFAQAALTEQWRAVCFIGVCDGCGGFGKNDRCENQFEDPSTSIPLRLNYPWWVTDHLPGSTAQGGDDPQNGDEILSSSPDFGARLTQVAFLSTNWRSNIGKESRLYGGARLFELIRDDATLWEHTARKWVYSPKANRKLR